MKFENTQVWGFEGALRGMRNPKNSWDRSDSGLIVPTGDANPDGYPRYKWGIGPNDMDLAMRLINAGPEHRKFLRYIHVQVDITAPLYWYKEYDTYKIATVANSTSTMHKITSQPITIDCFEIDDYDNSLKIYDGEPYKPDDILQDCVESVIEMCETLRQRYLETKDVRYWKELIRWLPEGWLQTRTVDLNYETLRAIYHQRKNHKLTEWHSFCEWVENLPYAKEFITN